jgi:CRP/FNR family transcriptional regulator, cyclic AMP receptor protein
MASLLTLTPGLPTRSVQRGEALIEAGEEASGDMYILERGRLSVERDGIVIATISEPGALIGEMSVLLGTAHSATVRAEAASSVRVIDNAIAFLERTPLVALHVATLACARLDATSALLVELRKDAAGKNEQTLLARIFGSLNAPVGAR